MCLKMDWASFNEYVKKLQENDAVNDKEFKTEERLFQIEQKLSSMVNKEDLKQ